MVCFPSFDGAHAPGILWLTLFYNLLHYLLRHRSLIKAKQLFNKNKHTHFNAVKETTTIKHVTHIVTIIATYVWNMQYFKK